MFQKLIWQYDIYINQLPLQFPSVNEDGPISNDSSAMNLFLQFSCFNSDCFSLNTKLSPLLAINVLKQDKLSEYLNGVLDYVIG